MTSVGREGKLGRLELARVAALDHGHPRVVAQAPVELPMGDVEGDHARRAALQQAVGEAAGRGADVEAVEAGDVDSQRLERVRELDAAAGDERRRLDHEQLGVVGDQLARLARERAVAAEPYPAGAHRLGRARTRAGEPALGEQRVDPAPAHRAHGTGELLRKPGGLERLLPAEKGAGAEDLACGDRRVVGELLVELELTGLAPHADAPEPEDAVAEVADLDLIEAKLVPGLENGCEPTRTFLVTAIDAALDRRRTRGRPLDVGGHVADREIRIVSVPCLDHPPERLDVLLRHRPPSIAPSRPEAPTRLNPHSGVHDRE